MATATAVVEFNPTAKNAVKAFRDAKPWRGTVEERGDKFAAFHREVCRAYDLETMLVRDDDGASEFESRTNRIIQRGRLSVVTYLYLLTLAVGMRRNPGMALARKTFAHYFPRSFAGCRIVGGMLVRR